MKYTQLFLKTSKESPADETARNADLLIRGGFIHKEMAGVYTFLPLGLRVLDKISDLIREEMNAAGAIEVRMSSFCPQENWKQTKRWDSFDVLYKVPMSSGGEVALSPTHEEIVTPIIAHYCQSPKDFPVCLYQIRDKFRNEPRAKSGILRGREFLMKDAYSFHLTQEDFEDYYNKMKTAYTNVYDRLGVGDRTFYVAASGGDFSRFSHEFQTLTEVGEDTLFYDKDVDEWYNEEIAPCQAPEWTNTDEKIAEREDVLGEGLIGVEALSEFLKIPVEKTSKTILFENEKGDVTAAVVRGDRDVNELKIKEIVDCKVLRLASEETVKKVTGAEVGYAGPLNLPDSVQVLWDTSCKDRVNFECGANQTNYHSINVNFGRDLDEPEKFYDISVATAGDTNPETGNVYETHRACEVGNIFPLANKFSKPFNLKIEGKEIIMGCYGIGVSRTMGILAEIFNDEKGLKWPNVVAPFQVYLAAIGKDDAVYERAEALEVELEAAGIEVLYDNRRDKKVGPGQKFGDAELIGLPYRVVLSEKLLEEGMAEVVSREDGAVEKVALEKLAEHLNK